MSFNDTITLTKADDTTTEDFTEISTVGLKSTRAVAGRELDQPKELVISHEVAKNKKRINSVLIIDQTEEDATPEVPVLGDLRVMMKVSYDTSVITAAQIKDAVHQVCDFFGVTANMDKFLNREH